MLYSVDLLRVEMLLLLFNPPLMLRREARGGKKTLFRGDSAHRLCARREATLTSLTPSFIPPFIALLPGWRVEENSLAEIHRVSSPLFMNTSLPLYIGYIYIYLP